MPRPRINPYAHRRNIALTLPPKLIERARAASDKSGMSISAMVEKSLGEYLERNFYPNLIDRTETPRHLPGA
jgi:hypothetical protein